VTATRPSDAAEDAYARASGLVGEYSPGETLQGVLGAVFDAGLAWVHFPRGLGGLGLPVGVQPEVDRILRDGGIPIHLARRNIIGVGMAAPTLVEYGRPDQQRRWLRPIYTNEEMWCQLFSEPGAGSDVASLATRAVADGDEWIIDGQKVWTTLAHVASFGLHLARTDPTVPKHQGLTYFVLDMNTAGVEVRPLRQLTGEAEFNEVFLTGVRVPDANRLGDIGAGWRVAVTTLMNERVAVSSSASARSGAGPVSKLTRLWEARGRDDPVLRDRVVRMWIEAEVNRLTTLRARDLRRAGVPGPEGSVAKLAWGAMCQRLFDLCVDILGLDGGLYPDGFDFSRPSSVRFDDHDERWLFLRSRANTIEGGTTEVIKNVLSERVLGLPPEPTNTRDTPWQQLPR
jgi:alkylation response protein AidB-like acyl-CoA dehydrogenase